MGHQEVFVRHREHLWDALGHLWGTERTYGALVGPYEVLMRHYGVLWGTMGQI